MTCRELADFIADYLSGEISDDVRVIFDHHLSICVNCRHYLDHYKTTIELGRHAFDDENAELPPEVPEDLVKAILASRKP
jgi:predicted anti-sigma-YlaC factor YlaD